MQLLSCLNLSNNKIKSFTALDPLRHLKSLKVLNISQNEIGNHSIDTTRYLCSSPLSHTEASDWKKSGLCSTDDARLLKYWEAFLLFRDLTLVQLGITGNAVVNEEFRSFLLKLLPTLKRLDDTNLQLFWRGSPHRHNLFYLISWLLVSKFHVVQRKIGQILQSWIVEDKANFLGKLISVSFVTHGHGKSLGCFFACIFFFNLLVKACTIVYDAFR